MDCTTFGDESDPLMYVSKVSINRSSTDIEKLLAAVFTLSDLKMLSSINLQMVCHSDSRCFNTISKLRAHQMSALSINLTVAVLYSGSERKRIKQHR